MMFLVGLMGLMAVGATAIYGFEGSAETDDDQNDMVQGATGSVPEDETDKGGLTNLLDDPDSEDPIVLRMPEEPDTFPDDAQDGSGLMDWGDAMNDSLEGTSGVDQLNGYQGDDTIFGLGGDDILHGDEGNDQLRGDAGADTLHGGRTMIFSGVARVMIPFLVTTMRIRSTAMRATTAWWAAPGTMNCQVALAMMPCMAIWAMTR